MSEFEKLVKGLIAVARLNRDQEVKKIQELVPFLETRKRDIPEEFYDFVGFRMETISAQNKQIKKLLEVKSGGTDNNNGNGDGSADSPIQSSDLPGNQFEKI